MTVWSETNFCPDSQLDNAVYEKSIERNNYLQSKYFLLRPTTSYSQLLRALQKICSVFLQFNKANAKAIQENFGMISLLSVLEGDSEVIQRNFGIFSFSFQCSTGSSEVI